MESVSQLMLDLCIHLFLVMEKHLMAQAGYLENTPLLPQRVKSGSVSGFALLSLRSRNHARSAFKRFSNHSAFAIVTEKSLYINGYPLFIDFGFDIFSKSGKYC